MTFPAADKAANDTGHVSDHNAIVKGLRGVGAGEIAGEITKAEAVGGHPEVVIAPGTAINTKHTVNRGITIRSIGRDSIVQPNHADYIFEVPKSTRNGEYQAGDTTYNPRTDLSRQTFRDMHINALDRTPARKGIAVIRGDDILMQNVQFGFIRGTALQLGGLPGQSPDDPLPIRECEFRDLRIYKCGDVNETPGLYIGQNDAGTGDGTNQLMFYGLRYVFNHGPLLVSNVHPTEILRRVSWYGGQLHGLSNAGTVGNIADHDLMIIEGNCKTVIVDHVTTNGSGGGGLACFRIRAAGGKTPDDVRITNLSATTSVGDIVAADAVGDITVSGRFNMSAIDGAAFRIKPNSGVSSYVVHATGVGSITGKFIVPSADQGKGIITWNGNEITPAAA